MVIATWVQDYNSRVPYVTQQEVLSSATAASIDFSNLVPDTSLNAQSVALQELIVRASQMADNYTLGALGTLCATVNTENGRYYANRLGQFIIQPYYWPILELQSFSFGYAPGDGQTAVTLNNSNTSIERHQFIITNQYGLSNATSIGNLNLVGGSWGQGQEMFCEWTYVNGFPNTFTSSAVSAGDENITVESSIGIYPGSVLTIWDGQKDENIQVASTYDGTSLTLPLASPVTFSHTKNTNVSSLPATVKQAVIHFICAMVVERGSGGLVINEIGEPTGSASRTMNTEWHMSAAYDLLEEFRQVWGRA